MSMVTLYGPLYEILNHFVRLLVAAVFVLCIIMVWMQSLDWKCPQTGPLVA